MTSNKMTSNNFKIGIVLVVAAVALCFTFHQSDLRDAVSFIFFYTGEFYLLFKGQVEEEQ